MRAGLLSDPRVVALLCDKFIPCLSSALNTADRIPDAADAALLRSYVREGGEQFQGGEREAFLLPDGTLLDVFMSLHGPNKQAGHAHMTAAGRRSESAWLAFRAHAEAALRRAAGDLPDDWASYWDGSAAKVRWAEEQPAAWPMPAPGNHALRVFIRNGHLRYDDLHGCELVPLDGRALCDTTIAVGASAVLTPALFRDLVRAMAPRGGVDTRLADASIGGELRFCGEALDGDTLTGRVTGSFAMTPSALAEAGRRESAASLFAARGSLFGRFALDRRTQRLRSLQVVASDVELRQLPRWQKPGEEGPVLPFTVAIEWVETPGRRYD